MGAEFSSAEHGVEVPVEPSDYNNLNGPQRAALRAAILDAFTRAELKMLLSDHLGRSWDNYTRDGGNLQQQVYDLIESSQNEGWTNALVREAEAKRPTNRHFARLDVTLGLMSPAQPPGHPPSEASLILERMIGKSEIIAFSEYIALQGRICRIEAGDFFGTGFLIANDLVLTNYHVIEKEKSNGQNIVCRFDYLTKGDVSKKGREARLSTEWLLASSPYAARDESIDGLPPTAKELDFAILRLSERVGEDRVNGVLRGSIKLSTDAPQPIQDDRVLIIQHPEGEPLAMSTGTVMGYDEPHLRIQYSASTRAGSSGSPVFASDLSLVALHHAGDPNWSRAAEYNQGIPIGLIADWIKAIDTNVEPSPPPLPPPLPRPPSPPPIGSLIILGEPKAPTPIAASTAVSELLQALAPRGVEVTQWTEGWRDQKPLSDPETAALFTTRPAFIRTIVDHAKTFPDEFKDLNYKLHRRLGLELDDDRDTRRELMQRPRILWRPGGPAWPGQSPQPPGYANVDQPEAFARWLADLLGLPEADADTVIHCEHPSYETDGGHARQIRQAVEQGLIQAIGDKPEPDRQVFAPGRLRDVLKGIRSKGLSIIALNDMSVPEPATRASAVDIFRRSDRDIDASIGSRPNLVRVAVLVRTADQFNGQLEFNAKARLRNWYLLRIPKSEDGKYAWDPDNVGFIHQQVALLRAGAAQPRAG
jgi:V8-like Glu-specific endopeptidase